MTTRTPRSTALVLAAGSSRRLGRPKQLLPLRGRTLLDAVLDVARASTAEQVVVVLGASAPEVREQVDLSGCDVVVNAAHGAGCSSSIAAALPAVSPRADTLVLLLGDQPGAAPAVVDAVVAARGEAPLAVCRYDDGVGHPFAFGREAFPQLRRLHGDRAVWKLRERWASRVCELRVDGAVPPDVDTEADYQHVLAAQARSDR